MDAHDCCEEVFKIFDDANILVWFCVPACTDLIQAIDAGIGKLIRIIYVGHAQDNKWLSADENLDLWEGSLSAKERRILMTNFLAEEMYKISSEEEKKNVRIGSAFEQTWRTMFLIELVKNNNRNLGDGLFSDDKIKPQGL